MVQMALGIKAYFYGFGNKAEGLSSISSAGVASADKAK